MVVHAVCAPHNWLPMQHTHVPTLFKSHRPAEYLPKSHAVFLQRISKLIDTAQNLPHIFTFTALGSRARAKTATPPVHERAQFVHVRVGTAQRHPANDRAAGCDPSKFAPREPGRLGVQPILCRAACPTQRPLGEARGDSSTRAQRALWHLSASTRAAWRDAQAPSGTRWGARTARGCSRGRA